MDIPQHNQKAWDGYVDSGNQWTLPVTSEVVQAARQGDWHVVLTPRYPVPRKWFGELPGKKLLGLASGGGQQGPILAAAGADVTILDYSSKQLQQDRMVAEREGLKIETIQGNMCDLSMLEDESFDIIFHPCSNGFIPDVNPVWSEAFRVLKPGCHLMAGFINPVFHIFDYWELEKGNLIVKYRVPYSDLDQLPQEKIDELIASGEALEFGHTLEDQIGGQLRAGFRLIDMFEDDWHDSAMHKLGQHIKLMMGTLALKP